MARFWPKWRYNGRVMAREVSFYQCLWVTKLCAKFGCSRTPRTASAHKSFMVLRCMWKEPAPFIFWNLSLSSNYMLWYPLIISRVALNENENSTRSIGTCWPQLWSSPLGTGRSLASKEIAKLGNFSKLLLRGIKIQKYPSPFFFCG